MAITGTTSRKYDECIKPAREAMGRLTGKYGVKLIEGSRCNFRDPSGNRIQVIDPRDQSLIWLSSYREVQKAGVKLAG